MEPPKLGRYLIQSEIGRGAMGVVYKATDTVLERAVAVKTINMALEGEEAAKYETRFYQEARAAGGLNHPNIVTVYDVGKSGDVAYMAMEFIHGEELRNLMKEGQPMPVARATSIAAQVAEGLAYAHSHGVVHRDIKPANIMVAEGAPVKITDFGIARMRAATELTQTGTMLGSPKYMSPEQVIGKRADHRSDIFSLGVILYEMLVGVPPFNGDNVTALMYQIVNFIPPSPSAVNASVPQLLDYVVAKMLAKSLDERYQDAQAAAHDLRECERQLAGMPDAEAASRTVPNAALATGPQARLADTNVRASVLAQTINRTRQDDGSPGETSAPPTRGLAPSFDSMEATQRLASMTATATREEPQTATQAVQSLKTNTPRAGWRRRDWLLFAGAGALGLIAARALLRARKS